MVPVILPILKTIGILDPCDAKINHIKCMWISDLHFVIQWFRFISRRRFDGGMLDWRYWFSVTLSLTYKCWSVTYILWYSDSAFYFQYDLMNKPHSLDIGSDMGHWPVFLPPHVQGLEVITFIIYNPWPQTSFLLIWLFGKPCPWSTFQIFHQSKYS